MGEERFDADQVEQLLARAAELEAQGPPAAGVDGMTLAEVEAIAHDAGLDPALVRKAATDLKLAPRTAPAQGSLLLGGPRRIERTIIVDFGGDLNVIANLAADHLDDMGSVRVSAGQLRWSTLGRGGRMVELAARRVDGRVKIEISESLTPLMGTLYGGLGGGVGGGLGGGLGWLFGLWFGGLGVLVWVLFCLAIAFGLARHFFSRAAAKRTASIDELADAIRMLDSTSHVSLASDEDADATALDFAEAEHTVEAEAVEGK